MKAHDDKTSEISELWRDSRESLQEEFAVLFGGVLPDLASRDLDSKDLAEVHRDLSKKRMPVALCLSGGGIRSATFSLGVLQALAFNGVLDRFHYLSTVSGGGFIGSWLSRWRVDAQVDADNNRKETGEAQAEALKIGKEIQKLKAEAAKATGAASAKAGARLKERAKAEAEAQATAKAHADKAAKCNWAQEQLIEQEEIAEGETSPVRRLRSFSNYLSPAWGLSLDALTIFDVVVRKFLYNFLFWTMLFLAVAMFARLFVGLVYHTELATTFGTFPGASPAAVAAISILPASILAVLAAIFLIVLLPARDSVEGQERLSRYSARLLALVIGWTGLFALFAIIPAAIAGYLDAQTGNGRVPVIVALVGLVTGLMGYWNRFGPDMRKQARSLIDILGVRILDLFSLATLVGLALIASMAAHGLETATRPFLPPAAQGKGYVAALGQAPYTSFVWLLGSLAAALGLSWALGANRSSLHSLYSLRLIRAYLGTARHTRRVSPSTDIDLQDDVTIAELQRLQDRDKPPVLFQVVNMTLNLTRGAGRRHDWQERRGAAFTATPLRTGSKQLGYVRSANYARKDGGLTLGRAMTISGAAASPNMGYFSSSLTALVMAILNIRLGWWLPNPKKAKHGETASFAHRLWWRLRRRDTRIGHEDFLRQSDTKIGFLRVLSEGLTRLDAESDWIYLSDGGHFENLGLYEMVRRRCATILVVDGCCDGNFKYADLHNAIRKIQVDFGIPIDLPPSLPGQEGVGKDHRYVVGRIRYTAVDPKMKDGRIYILKPLLTGNEPPSLIGYAESSRSGSYAFPHHSTTDQFFNETQFESYRLLGVKSAEDVLETLLPVLRDGKAHPELFYPDVAKGRQPSLAPDSRSPGPAVTTPPKDEEEKQLGGTSALPPSGAAGGIVETIRQMSTGQLAATALGAVAAATVAGNVADNLADEAPAAVEYIVNLAFPPAKTETGKTVRDPPGGTSTSDSVALMELRNEIVRLDERIDLLPAPPPDLTRQLELLRERVGKLETEPRVPPADLRGISGEIAALKTKLAQAEGEIAETKRRITGAEGRILKVEGRITTAERNIRVAQRRIGRLDPANNVRGQ
ncbi:MAG TPA: patatin-like phospholipase family protein [Allosphingosinicella sp.]